MAKKLHRKSASSSNKLNSANMTDDFQLHLDSSDDDAPEEVTFEDSKASALRNMKDALETAKRSYLELKLKATMKRQAVQGRRGAKDRNKRRRRKDSREISGGTEKKAKAEKLKKQWIHKQKVPSS
ncbi:unnamed protein product [Coregonus sp. 'balchen']|nr:unnamed protein product [Coregonus sp. 'balchen']